MIFNNYTSYISYIILRWTEEGSVVDVTILKHHYLQFQRLLLFFTVSIFLLLMQ